MFSEDDLLPLSALQHLSFCERQCALIHIERLWEENRLTSEGRLLHDRVHDSQTESRPGAVICRGLPLRSLRLGISGQADVVEFLPSAEEGVTITLPGRSGQWRPFPVEYKRGRPKAGACDEVQLCAQAVCLEEALSVRISEGALYYNTPRRRQSVLFDSDLRARTEALAVRLHELVRAGSTPPPVYEKKCNQCSLVEICMPRAASPGQSVSDWLDRELSRQ